VALEECSVGAMQLDGSRGNRGWKIINHGLVDTDMLVSETAAKSVSHERTFFAEVLLRPAVPVDTWCWKGHCREGKGRGRRRERHWLLFPSRTTYKMA
jgi:hypothetical protein